MPAPRVLCIAGTDPSGGAGLLADLKSVAANGGYGMGAVTALTAQNTRGVRGVHVPPADFLAEQLYAVSDDITIDAVKIGMLGTAEVAAVVGEWLDVIRPPVVVLDPVMVATSGDRLLVPDAEAGVQKLFRAGAPGHAQRPRARRPRRERTRANPGGAGGAGSGRLGAASRAGAGQGRAPGW